MSGKEGGKIQKPGAGGGENKSADKKPRAQPGDFERQVDQIRKDIDSVRSNLADAEKALGKTEAMNSTASPAPGGSGNDDGNASD